MTTTFADYRDAVRPAIEARLEEAMRDVALRDLYGYVVDGGKRVRPALTLLVAEALGGKRETALDLACSVELTHCASLVLDDILDGHGERRGREALHLHRGLQVAVTTGFTLPSLALDLAARHGASCAQALSGAWVALCLGAYRDTDSEEATWAAYLQTVELKTGRLFATACAFGARASRRREDEYGAFGLHLGNAFQLADDLVDGTPPDRATRVRRTLEEEVLRAEAQVDAWPEVQPALGGLLRATPRDLVALKEERG